MTESKTRSVTLPRGFRAAGGTCGLKPSGQPDLALIVADHVCDAAAVFTRNKVPGAPVVVSKRHIRGGAARAIVCNSGTANVCTGETGIEIARAMCKQVATVVGDGCKTSHVLVNSTGVIGRLLPMEKILTGIETLHANLAGGPAADRAAAKAILTTDLTEKCANRRFKLSGKTVTIGGIAKGSGMIAPNMATMLAFLTTDANIDAKCLKAALVRAVNKSFNRISVDADTSTSDSVQILAGGDAGNRRITSTGKAFDAFCEHLDDLCKELAYKIIEDGEGATRIFRVRVIGARHEKDADRVGRTVVGSPLVKTAVHGADPNWGRLVMAVGRSGAMVKPSKLSIAVHGLAICEGGMPNALTPAQTRKLDQYMQRKEVTFTIDLGVGDASCEWLGCDLSRDYIRINADYTT